VTRAHRVIRVIVVTKDTLEKLVLRVHKVLPEPKELKAQLAHRVHRETLVHRVLRVQQALKAQLVHKETPEHKAQQVRRAHKVPKVFRVRATSIKLQVLLLTH